MLEKYDIEVDMLRPAEQAMNILKSNRPDAIHGTISCRGWMACRR